MHNATPLFSIIVCALDAGGTIKRCLRGVQEQQYKNYELIVIDGGSKDNTLDLLKQNEALITHLVSEPDKGPPDASNKGIGLATGDFICFLNADDALGPETLQAVAKVAEANPKAEVITCSCQIRNQQEGVIHSFTSPKELGLAFEDTFRGLTLFNARFYKRTLFEKYGLLRFDKCYFSNDREFIARLALNDVPYDCAPEGLYIYYDHPGSLSFSKANIFATFKEHFYFSDHLLNEQKLTPNQHAFVKKWANEQYVKAFCWGLYLRNPNFALQALKQGMAKYHLSFAAYMAFYPFEVIVRQVSRKIRKGL